MSINKQKIIDCDHLWKSILLLNQVVYDCEKCYVKKEDWENNYSKEKKEKEQKEHWLDILSYPF